ncbi:MAG: hypothetical protein ICV66_09800, partial [Chitinophagaceae bacterium]|nr:hypothetical protein [Chitinophagaceae bacterium]
MQLNKRIIMGSSSILKSISLGIIAWAFYSNGFAQCATSPTIWNRLTVITNDNSLSTDKKLQEVLLLKKQFEGCQLPVDSVYARLLDRAGFYEYSLRQTLTSSILNHIVRAIRINISGAKSVSPSLAVNSYFNLGTFYEEMLLYNKALNYFDSTIILAQKCFGQERFVVWARNGKMSIFKQRGDYQKCVEEITMGLPEARKINDSTSILQFFNQRAEVYYYQSQIESASSDTDSALVYAKKLRDTLEYASALKIKALIAGLTKQLPKADSFYKATIKVRVKTKDYKHIADDYIDLGNFYLKKLNNYAQAKRFYVEALQYATKANNLEKEAKAHTTIGIANFYQGNLKGAEQN